MILSGKSGEAPPAEDFRALAEETGRAIAQGERERAVSTYVLALRGDPDFILPPERQLWMADSLARLGRPQLAKDALERFLLRNPGGPWAAHGELLLGYVEQEFFQDYAAAVEAFERAANAEAAQAKTRADARARLKAARAVLEKTVTERAAPGEPYWILQESGSRLWPRQLADAARVLGVLESELAKALDKSPGLLARDVPADEACRKAALLEKGGVPVVVIPRGRLLEASEVVPSSGMSGDAEAALLMAADGQPVRLPWADCLLLIATTLKGAPLIELVGLRSTRRFRWTTDSEKTFFDVLQGLVLAAHDVPLAAGAFAAFRRKLLAECSFADQARLDAYVFWQMQLAHLKKAGTYRAWAAAGI